MTLLDIVFMALVVLILICPCAYDPAIRLKEWVERRRAPK